MSTSICPICGSQEPVGAFLCSACGADYLTVVPGVSSDSTAPEVVRPDPRGQAGQEQACRQCGLVNESWALLCVGCAADLPRAPGVVRGTAFEGGAVAEGSPVLTLTVNGRTFECNPGDVLGREGTLAPEEFQQVVTVHRRHVQLGRDGGRWHLVVLEGVRNLTELDGRPLERGRKEFLTGKHQLQLSRGLKVGILVGGSLG